MLISIFLFPLSPRFSLRREMVVWDQSDGVTWCIGELQGVEGVWDAQQGGGRVQVSDGREPLSWEAEIQRSTQGTDRGQVRSSDTHHVTGTRL